MTSSYSSTAAECTSSWHSHPSSSSSSSSSSATTSRRCKRQNSSACSNNLQQSSSRLTTTSTATRTTLILILISVLLFLTPPGALADDSLAVGQQPPPDLQETWNELRNYALNVLFDPCSNDIVETLDESNYILLQQGVTREFVESLWYVQTVAGDIPESEEFRSQLLVTFYQFANSINYSGETLDNKTMGGFRRLGFKKPVLYQGHRVPGFDYSSEKTPVVISGAQAYTGLQSRAVLFGSVVMTFVALLSAKVLLVV
ncbi:hypothetical protein HDU76_004285 [Blyttiomyces sp. JEL0837]|nr:hypothetical protein HDU76_004285 [Blyttiomyces sp. JEL0837]